MVVAENSYTDQLMYLPGHLGDQSIGFLLRTGFGSNTYVNLPGMSGSDLVTALRRTLPESAQPMVLLVSGEVPTEMLGDLTRIGADDFMVKPFLPAEFRSRVRALFGRKEATSRKNRGAATVRIGMAELTRTPAPKTFPEINLPPALAAMAGSEPHASAGEHHDRHEDQA